MVSEVDGRFSAVASSSSSTWDGPTSEAEPADPALQQQRHESRTELTRAKRALEEVLFGRLEGAMPIRRRSTLVLKQVSPSTGGCRQPLI